MLITILLITFQVFAFGCAGVQGFQKDNQSKTIDNTTESEETMGEEESKIAEFGQSIGVSEEEYYQELDELSKRITLVLDNDASTTNIVALVECLENMSEVYKVEFTSKEQALDLYRSKVGSEQTATLELGVLPGIIEISLYDSADVPRISELLLSQESYLAINATPDNPADSIKTYL
jgi:hypothetical protein